MRKLDLTHVRPFPIALAILIGTKNLVSWRLCQDSISSHKFKLNQFQTLNKLASFPFNEIELECDPNSQLCDSVFIFESLLILVSEPNLDQFSEPTFIPVYIDIDIESPISYRTFY